MADGKLVRDKIPEIIRRNGGNPQTHIALILEYEQLLGRKLMEEAYEFYTARDPVSMLEELADLLEVVDAIFTYHGRHHNITRQKVAARKKQKNREKGKFSKRIVLENPAPR